VSTASIPVDLLNPGQVFACLGFLEAAELLLGDAQGGFDWKAKGDARFHLKARGEADPVEAVLQFLSHAEVHAVSPDLSELSLQKWNVPTDLLGKGEPFPFALPRSPATLPAALVEQQESSGNRREIPLDYWGDSTNRDNVKFWAGAAGYPGAGLARDALKLIRPLLQERQTPLFAMWVPQSSSFRFDWRRDYIALDTGFSVNDHHDIHMAGFPIVELLAAIGVSNARPERLDKLSYRYGVIGAESAEQLLDPIFLRAALGCAPLPFPQRIFSMHLGWPGQKNQARCITAVVEEPRA
jgi:CRISPR-associated protein Csx14